MEHPGVGWISEGLLHFSLALSAVHSALSRLHLSVGIFMDAYHKPWGWLLSLQSLKGKLRLVPIEPRQLCSWYVLVQMYQLLK